MTTFVAAQAVSLSSLEEFDILNSANIGSATFAGDNSSIVVTLGGVEIKFTGDFPSSGPTTASDLSAGIITGIEVRVGGLLSYTISDLSMLGSNLLDYVDAADPDAWIGDVLLAGDDTITGSDFADLLDGYGGADTITGGGGLDTIHGGDGDDILVVRSPEEVEAGETYDGGAENDTLKVTSDDDVDLSAVTISNIENLTGTHYTTLSMTAAQLDGFSGTIDRRCDHAHHRRNRRPDRPGRHHADLQPQRSRQYAGPGRRGRLYLRHQWRQLRRCHNWRRSLQRGRRRDRRWRAATIRWMAAPATTT